MPFSNIRNTPSFQFQYAKYISMSEIRPNSIQAILSIASQLNPGELKQRQGSNP